MVYLRPEGLDMQEEKSASEEEQQESKEQKQIDAMLKALQKNPSKLLAKVLEQEDDIKILSDLLQQDEKITLKMAELLIKDKEKAAKVAAGFVNKEKKRRLQAEKGGEE